MNKRVEEEVARASGRPGALAVATCRIDNIDEITHARDAGFARRVLQTTAEALCSHLRDFDVAGRTDDGEITVLLPEPGHTVGDRVLSLARSVADDVSKQDDLNEPVRVVLTFGYAAHPDEGATREALLQRAREPRIRMV